jgi:hypothetical protein
LSILTEDFPSIPDIELNQPTERATNSLHTYDNIVSQLSSNLKMLIESTKIEDLNQLACDLKSLLTEEVNYSELERKLKEEGKTDEEGLHEAKKKAYGAELFKRQRAFADLKKSAAEYGLNYRKGLLLPTEELNELSMTKSDEAVGSDVSKLINYW